MRIRPAFLVLGMIAVAGLAGCGSTTVRHVTTTITRSASTASAGSASRSASGSSTGGAASTGPALRSASGSSTGGAATTPGTGGSSTAPSSSSSSSSTTGAAAARTGVSGRSPRAIIDAAAHALGHAGAYAMRADLIQQRVHTQIALTTTGRRKYDATLSTGGSSFDVILLSGRAYLRGDRTFWQTHSGSGTAARDRARAARLAGHWLSVPATGADSVTKSLGTLSPGTLARCLTEDHGTLTIAGHATVAGVQAVIVRDAGNVPGSTPSTIAVAASGVPYPLRYVATGATRSGGRIDVCNDGKGDGATGTISLSEFGKVPAIHAPAGAESDSGAPVA